MTSVTLPNTAANQDGTTIDFGDVYSNDSAITTVVNGNIDATNLADGAVTTATLADDAVTAAKIANVVMETVTANTQTASYTLVLTDAGGAVDMNSAAATTVTVPPNSSVAFTTGTVIEVTRLGAGTVQLVAGVGVTLNSDTSKTFVGVRYGAVSLRKTATDTWLLVGNLSAS